MGLLDTLGSDEVLGGLLSAGAASGAKGNFLARMAAGLQAGDRFGQGRREEARQRSQDEMRAEYQKLMQMKMQRDMQQQEAAAKQEGTNTEALRRSLMPTSGIDALSGGGGPTQANEAQIGQQRPFDVRQFIAQNPGVDLAGIQQYMALDKAINPAAETKVFKPGDIFGTVGKDGTVKQTFAAPEKAAAPPTSVQEYLYGQQNPGFNAWDQSRKKAGATNIGMPKIDIKMGDSVAGQIGPMGKDSRIKAESAVTMYDAAGRIQKALDSGKVSAGPGTSAIQTVKQLVQKVGGGNDESIRQTQQVIRSLSKMAVEARKQLQGQGQVTENEARAVEKADSGNIDDLTTGELQDLVTLTKRAAYYTAKSHQEFLSTMEQNEGTRGAAPFYKVRGLEPLLSHEPKLPQIGGGGDVRSQADAILKGK